MKWMLPTLKDLLPEQKDWVYEIKYDGFRALLKWTKEGIELISRNGNDLLPQFPEINGFCKQHKLIAAPHLPIILDGELVILKTAKKANFSAIQKRGRLKSKTSIEDRSQKQPADFLAFDILQWREQNCENESLKKRKQLLAKLFTIMDLPLSPTPGHDMKIQMVPFEEKMAEALRLMHEHNSEGIVGKKLRSAYERKRTENWVKLKNWRKVRCFITSYDEQNGYYDVAVYKLDQAIPLGSFHFGLTPEEKRLLSQTIIANASKKIKGKYFLPPSICVELHYLEVFGGSLREPHFHQFLFDVTPKECTYDQFQLQSLQIPQTVEITHSDKPLWGETIHKLDYLSYLKAITPRILPFLKDRPLTVIRYPHGVSGEAFYQKNCPDYAPDFVQTKKIDDIEYIICNFLDTYFWLGNQLAIEFHIPFQTIDSAYVSEIVFDLDPPSRAEYPLAVQCAMELKEILDSLKLASFVKFSGNKGLQVYVPLLIDRFSWEETNQFTDFIAHYLTSKRPNDYTIERLKKNRGGKLYIDYVQHRPGKTIIAPYSLRGNPEALAAVPLYWEEVEHSDPLHYSMFAVMERLDQMICPFSSFFETDNEAAFQSVIDHFNVKKPSVLT
ncbi:bifunctional non-homologous end joining protein LigD [Bacillus ectoiniformans]|uniref:DNA ligase D n=1 Tax=Bacillus ectoiniformans TaxID=1494429 RepID=UPI00195D935D|nr:DNA ligase D [Bacillus ectoiniformans]MBM7649117.1 bifunctional non-homologous end joining protein LigD [Bacillus ectoiniformans]